MGLILSIDVGTTNLKAGIVDENGEILALRRVQTPVLRPETGAAEHGSHELYEILIAVCREVSRKFKHDVEHIVLSSYQLGLILLDEHHSPLTGLTLLSDIRARDTMEEFKTKIDTAELYRRTGCPPMIQYPLARLFYFQKRKPELMEKARHFLGSKDFLLFQLTGELLTEPSIASATQMLNTRTIDWDDETLSIMGIDRSRLPRVVDGFRTAVPVLESVRKELGLTSTKLDVVPGLYDGGALAVGLSGLRERVAVMNIGTSAMVRMPSPKPAFDLSENMRLQPYCLSENLYLNGGALNNATLPINWMRDRLFELDLVNIPKLDLKRGAPLFCLPYLTGERDAKIGPHASGVFFGLRDHHGPQDMLRSVMEGVSFSLCLVKDALVENGNEINELRMGGGGAGSKVWTQIFADVFNAPIKLPQGEEIALIGNAIIAYTALGKFPSLDKAAESMVKIGATIDPEPAGVKLYEELFEFFKELRTSVGALYQRHSSLCG